VHLQVKATLLVFFDHQGIVYYNIAPEGQIINQAFYLVVLRCLWDLLWRKQPEMWTVGSWLFH
jgi:hypothetical protein